MTYNPSNLLGQTRFSSSGLRMPFLGAGGSATGSYTVCSMVSGEAPWDYIRLVYLNYTTTAQSITSASFANTSKLNDRVNPTNAAGTQDNTLWQPAYFNNGGADGFVPSPTGTTRTFTIPAAIQGTLSSVATYDKIPGIAYSDWMYAPSLARTDTVGALPLLMVRTYGATVPCQSLPISPGPITNWDAYANGRLAYGQALSGDQATTPGGVSSSGTQNYFAPDGVQFIYRSRGLSVMSVGDSIPQGFGGATTQNDPLHIAACALSTPTFPITAAKCCYQGMSSASFVQSAYNLASGIRPDVMFLKGSSPNDVGTSTQGSAVNFAASLARLSAQASWCVSQGIRPILATELPWSYATTPEANRQAFNATIRASGQPYIDWDAALASAPGAGGIATAYNSTTYPKHPNDAGATLVAQQYIQILSAIIAQNTR